MQTQLEIRFRGFDSTERLEDYVRTRASKLERFSDRITGCHVMIESPHQHKKQGAHHRVRIDILVPGAELVVTRDPLANGHSEDVYASIDAAFDDAKRVLEDHVRKQRGDSREFHETLRTGERVSER